MTFRNILNLNIFFWKNIPIALRIFFPLMLSVALSHYFDGQIAQIGFIVLNFILGAYAVPKWVHYQETGGILPILSFGLSEQIYFKKNLLLSLISFAITFTLSFGYLMLAFFLSSKVLNAVLALTHGMLPNIDATDLILPILGLLTIFCVIFYLLYRFTLVLPAASLGERLSFKRSWQLSKGHFWQFFWNTFLVTLTALVIPGAIWFLSWWALEINLPLMPFAALMVSALYTLFLKDFYKMCVAHVR